MSENRLWWAHLFRGSPRYCEWHLVLASDDVPLVSCCEQRATLDKPDVPVYLVDVKQLSEDQRRRLARVVAVKFGAREDEVRGEFEANGHFPIRSEDVIVAFSLRAFI